MIEAARRNKRIVQLGTQSRSRPVTQRFVEYVQSGKIGDVLMVKVWNVQGRGTPGALPPDEPVPAGLDYDTWTGPIPKLPFSRRRFGGATNMHWHYGTGDIGNDGIHWLDIGRWVLGVEKPVEISGMGGRIYLSGDEQTPPDTMNITYDYKGKLIFFEQRLWNPYRLEGSENTVAAYGTKGYAQVGRWNNGYHAFRVFDDKNRQIHFDQEERPDDHKHHINFIECIRSRKKPNADIETGHVSTLLVHLGNIVARTGRNIRFDGSTERVIDDEKANNYLTREYREHWSKPRGV
jgi:predicted dehydrogenase